MQKWLRRLGWTLVVLFILGAPAYYVLVVHSPAAGATEFPLDMAEIRALANSVPGDKAAEIRYEHVASFEFAEAMVVAGDPWKGTLLPVYSFQLVFPMQTLVIDGAMDRQTAQPASMVPFYDDAAYARMSEGLEKASLIVITHEHMDHIGGIASHPNLPALLPALRLTDDQLSHPDRMAPSVLPANLFEGYKPLSYRGTMALAPGVVLIKAPGHTPGSQMVYVQLADGRELLFVGDVAWHQRSIDLIRERPLFMTTIIKEDRDAVLSEFVALNRLAQSDPAVKIVPGHDGPVVDALVAAKYLQPGFVRCAGPLICKL